MTDIKYRNVADICRIMRNMSFGRVMSALTVLVLMASSCEKKESPVTLPPLGTAQHSTVEIGENYRNQLYFDIESGQVVYTNDVLNWDLAFEATASGYHLFMNGGKNVLVGVTGDTSFSAVNSTSYVNMLINQNDGAWKFDFPCGSPDSTGVGEWTDGHGNSKQQVYLVSTDSTYKKFKLISVDDQKYVMQYGDIDSQYPEVIEIPKSINYNYSYFVFAGNNHIVSAEPPKNTWDIVFTRYRHIYENLNNFKYIVTGVLFNPYKTTGLADSTSGYANINTSSIAGKPLSSARDVIGFDWKTYDYTSSTARYVVNPNKCYVVKTRKGQFWKLHFLDYYSTTGVKGTPTFEYERME